MKTMDVPNQADERRVGEYADTRKGLRWILAGEMVILVLAVLVTFLRMISSLAVTVEMTFVEDAVMLGSGILYCIGFRIASRDGLEFRAAMWFELARVALSIASIVVFWITVVAGPAGTLQIFADICGLFAINLFLTSLSYIAHTLADRITGNLAYYSRGWISLGYGLFALNRALSILVNSLVTMQVMETVFNVLEIVTHLLTLCIVVRAMWMLKSRKLAG